MYTKINIYNNNNESLLLKYTDLEYYFSTYFPLLHYVHENLLVQN